MTNAGERRRRACSDCLSWWTRRHNHRAAQRTWLCWDSPPEALAQPWPEIQASIQVGIALERQYCKGMPWLLSSVSVFLDPDPDDLYVRTAHGAWVEAMTWLDAIFLDKQDKSDPAFECKSESPEIAKFLTLSSSGCRHWSNKRNFNALPSWAANLKSGKADTKRPEINLDWRRIRLRLDYTLNVLSLIKKAWDADTKSTTIAEGDRDKIVGETKHNSNYHDFDRYKVINLAPLLVIKAGEF